MRLNKTIYNQMVSHALEDAPNECCGYVSARDGEAVALHRVTNSAHSPLKYVMDPKEQLAVEYGEIYDKGLDVGAIYHSHTRSAPYPSQTDVNLATHPEAVYVIVGVKNPDKPVVRGYYIRKGQIEEIELTVI
ncbi:MAG: M67 family metallopeptidase [Solirubrobacterales bacterium]|nr:M67 family metallopeptidase [Solirubrobacterales bacterium]